MKSVRIIVGMVLLNLVMMAQGAAATSKAPLVLVKNGKPNATLVLSINARQPAKLAAAEFQRVLERITGVRLPEVTDDKPVIGNRVLIGESKATRALGVGNKTLGYEEYCIRTGPNTLILAGHDEDVYGELSYEKDGTYPGFQWYHQVGSLWAVLDFLERSCGVRWYLPGDIGEVIKPAKTLAVAHLGVKRHPWARHRWIIPRPFPQRLYNYLTLSLEKGPMTVEQLAGWKDTNLWWLHQRNHDEPAPFSHNQGNTYQEYAKTHPEYFIQPEPNKPIRQEVTPGTPLAYQRPEVAVAMAKEAIAYFDLPLAERQKLSSGACSPETYALSPLDGAGFDQRPDALAKFDGPDPKTFWNGWGSRYIWDFVNETARLVAKKYPDKWVSCFAYNNYLTPYPGMKIEPNVAVQFCRDLPDNWYPPQRAEFDKALAAWQKIKPQRFYLFEYYLFPAAVGEDVFPGFLPHKAAADLKYMKKIGLRGAHNDIDGWTRVSGSQMKDGIWAPCYWMNPALDMVNFYIWNKYLDDQSRSVDELLNEMYASFYGPAGKSIQKFVNLAEKLYWNESFYRDLIKAGKGHIDNKTSWTIMCPPERLKEFGRLIEAAKAAAQTPEQKQRVQIFDEGVYQMMKTSSELYLRDNPILTAANSIPLSDPWKLKVDPEDKGRAAQWFAPGLDDTGWQNVSSVKWLEEQGFRDYKLAWYRIHVKVPVARTGQKVTLRLGAVDETCWIWVNGQPAGEFIFDITRDAGSWERPMFFDITKQIKYGADNQITILVQNLAGMGGVWKQPSQLIFKTVQK